MNAATEHDYISRDEYLEGELLADVKHEYVRGRVYAMAGTSKTDNAVCSNLLRLMLDALEDGPCQAYIADVKVDVAPAEAFYYPDVVVTCDPRDAVGESDNEYTVRYPKVIVEVLSESTADFDQGAKFDDYSTLDSLEEYVLVDSRRRSVRVLRRGEGGDWVISRPDGGHVELTSLELRLSVDAIYRRTPFAEPQPSPATG